MTEAPPPKARRVWPHNFWPRILWPRSLGWRTAITLLGALMVVQAAGLTIHAYDRVSLQRLAEVRELAAKVMGLYRSIVLTPPDQRPQELYLLRLPPGFSARLAESPGGDGLMPLPVPAQQLLRLNLLLVPLPPELRPRGTRFMADFPHRLLVTSIRLPDGEWLVVTAMVAPPRLWMSADFLLAFLGMTAAASVLILWAVRRLTAPVRLLAEAAERLGRDVNAPPLSEDGPSEVAIAAAAFNTMALRIRRFVQDRTFLLAAIGHDLRTPITRLKLRAEFIEDDEQRGKFLSDLDELEAMVSATLAFSRDISATEAPAALDLPALLRTVLDETADAAGEGTPDAPHASPLELHYEGPAQLTVQARPMAIKRAISNLVGNAVKYGGGATVRLVPPSRMAGGAGLLRIDVMDRGPGIPPEELERVFEPFQRLEQSRNRETGGTGLGLPIARNVLRAHGGDVVLRNRAGGGISAVVTLPA